MNRIWILFGVHQKRNLNAPEKKIWIWFWVSGCRQVRTAVDRHVDSACCLSKFESCFFSVECGQQACRPPIVCGRQAWRPPTVFLICLFSKLFFFNLDWIFFDHYLFLKTRQFDNIHLLFCSKNIRLWPVLHPEIALLVCSDIGL